MFKQLYMYCKHTALPYIIKNYLSYIFLKTLLISISDSNRLNVKGKSESVAMVTSPNASSKQMIKSENDTRGSQKSQVKGQLLTPAGVCLCICYKFV